MDKAYASPEKFGCKVYKEIDPWGLEAICSVGKLSSAKTQMTVQPKKIRENHAGKWQMMRMITGRPITFAGTA